MAVKTGKQLKSVNGTQVVIIRGTDEEGTLTCAGVELGTDAQPNDADLGEPLPVGKRYSDDETGLEVLIVKPGPGPLAYGGRELGQKEARVLPASD